MFENKIIFAVQLLCIFDLVPTVIVGQVCSPTGQLCTRSTDCCKGCCESHTCVERPMGCTDLMSQPGFDSCDRFYCPPGQICYLREVCPPEDPCPRLPGCRRIELAYNYTDYRYYRNSVEAGFSKFNTLLNLTIMGTLLLCLNRMQRF